MDTQQGQYLAKQALEIAAAGSHHTMLIKAFPSILPDKRIRNQEPRNEEMKKRRREEEKKMIDA